MSLLHRFAFAVLLAGAAAASLAALPASAEDQPVSLRILAINDFHGNLKPPSSGIRVADPNDPTKSTQVPAGGAAQMASLIKLLSDGQPNTIFVAAGDLIGASPFLSAMFHDEPTIESMSQMGLALSAVGNHEFDEGKDELLRMQNGGYSAVDIIISGHTHQAYVCTIDKRLVTSADKFGTLVTAIDVKLDRTTRGIISTSATNIVVDATLPKDPTQTALIDAYEKLAAPIANRPAGVITQVLSRLPNAAGESALGDVIADAQLAATSAPDKGSAVIAMTNPGGIRTDLARRDDGAVTFADVFASQPFRNQLVTVMLTGTEIKAALEQQWLDPARPRILQISRGFSYAFDATQPAGARIDAATLTLNGKAIDPTASYRVTLNNYLALGGDGFTTFKSGREPIVGPYDDEALFAYLKANSPLAPPPRDRIVNKAQ
ncbi:bifunctional metallophosphatase/5'-nucleotidase [Bradyrhizobium sp. USDA 4353]